MAHPTTTDGHAALPTLEQLLARPGEYPRDTPLRMATTAGSIPPPTLSLYDFNILARPYCDGVRRFRTHPTPELLAWDWRRARIHEMLDAAQADVVCMQELVQAEFESAEQRAAQEAARAAQAAREAQEAQAVAQRKAEMARKAAAKAARAQARQAQSNAVDDKANGAAAATPAAAEAASAATADPAASPSPSPSPAPSAASDAPAPASAPAAAAAADAGEANGVQDDSDLRDDDGDDEINSTASVNYVPPAEGDFSTFLTSRGYAYRLQTPAARADKYPVGTGIFWKVSRFYEQPVVVDSRSRALIVALKLRPMDRDAPEPPASLDNVVFVCNVHLQGHHSETATRLNQVKSLFKQLEKHVASVARGGAGAGAGGGPGAATAKSKQKSKGKTKGAETAGGEPAPTAAAASSGAATPAVASSTPAAATPAAAPASTPMLLLTGDFNQNHVHSAVHRLAVCGRVPAGFVDERLRSHPDLFAQRGVVTPVEVSQPFALRSVYSAEERPSEFFPRYTFHNNHYVGSPYNDVLDYIYHTPSLPLLASMRVLGNEEEVARIEETSLPNELIPSDHLPVGATFFVPSLARDSEARARAMATSGSGSSATAQQER